MISANVTGFDLIGPSNAIQKSFAQWDNWEISGQSKELGKSSESMFFSIALAIFLVYVIMASTFEHIIHPLVILFTVPLAIIGVLFALWIFSVPLSIVVFIGLIVLAGVVVNNAIVLARTMALFTTTPARTIRPIKTTMLNGTEKIHRAKSTPMIASGTVKRMTSG